MDDLDALLNQFVRMGTRDHDELVNQFCTIIPSAEADIARFFLEANGWTLQDAIASFFDNAGPDMRRQLRALNRPKPQFAFTMRDDGDVKYAPGQRFQKVWMFKNTGPEKWPAGVFLVHMQGELYGGPNEIGVPQLGPGDSCPLALDFVAPRQGGQYFGTWQMQLNDGGVATTFGDPLWVVIAVNGDAQPAPTPFSGWGKPTGFGQNMDMSDMREAMNDMDEMDGDMDM